MIHAAGPHFKLAKAIHSLGVARALAPAKKQSDVDFFRASSTGTCPRQVYYGRIGQRFSNNFTPNSRERMDKGTVLHDHIRAKVIPQDSDYWVQAWKPEPVLVGSFKVGNTIVNLKGHCDGLLRYKKHPEPLALLEIKTTSLYGYRSVLKASFTDPDHYSFKYFIQANRYFYLWNKTEGFPKVKRICILVYNVNGDEDPETGVCWRDWWFEPSPEVFKEDLDRLAKIERGVASGEVPERGYTDKNCWDCAGKPVGTGCLYYNTCWGIRKRSDRSAPTTVSPKATKKLPATKKQAKSRAVPRGSRVTKKSTGRVLGKGTKRK